MPKKAFWNLSEETRNELIEKTMRLYASHPYEDVTLAMILETLSIHPTTFYRYFDDKDELFCVILRNIALKRKAYLEETHDYSSDFFMFNASNMTPLTDLEQEFVKCAFYAPAQVLLNMYTGIFKDETVSELKERLRIMRYDGKLRPDIDDDLISYIGATIPLNLMLFCRQAGISDWETVGKVNRYFMENFFTHGLMTDEQYSENNKK